MRTMMCPAGELVKIKDMRGLSQFKENEVGGIDNVVAWNIATGNKTRRYFREGDDSTFTPRMTRAV